MDRNRRFTIRLSPTEFQRLHDLAHKHGVSVSDLMRAAVLGPYAAQALPSRDVLTAGVLRIARSAQSVAEVARRVQEAQRGGQLNEQVSTRTVEELRRLHTPLLLGLNDILAELNRLRSRR